jgi:hypothetical protein
MARNTSVRKAINIGLVTVNGPVLPLLLAPMLIVLPHMSQIERSQGLGFAILLFFGSFISGLPIAWAWWSVSVPRWRLWAYERVEDIPLLKKRAVQVGLVWPEGHFLARTEFKTAAHAAKEKAFEQAGA